MIRDDYTAWDECPDVDNCELIQSFLELVDSMLQIAAYYGRFCGAKRPQCEAERPGFLLI